MFDCEKALRRIQRQNCSTLLARKNICFAPTMGCNFDFRQHGVSGVWLLASSPMRQSYLRMAGIAPFAIALLWPSTHLQSSRILARLLNGSFSTRSARRRSCLHATSAWLIQGETRNMSRATEAAYLYAQLPRVCTLVRFPCGVRLVGAFSGGEPGATLTLPFM